LYNQQNRFNDAKVILEKAVLLDPDDVGAHFELGKAFKAIDDLASARIEFNTALKKINRWRIAEKQIIANELEGIGK
jgi:Flp pilus assembly protein TadD